LALEARLRHHSDRSSNQVRRSPVPSAASDDVSARPWLAEYPAGVAADIDLNIYASLAGLVENAAAQHGGRTAYHQFGVELTFGQLDTSSARPAAYFQHGLRLQPGDRIALMMPNVMHYPIALLAALRAGLTVVNVNPLYTAPELVALITDAAPCAIVVL